MTFRAEDGQGAHALDLNQQLARLLGRGVVNGGRVTATGDWVVNVAPVTVYLNGELHTVAQTNNDGVESSTPVDLAAYVADEPRKVVLYIDTNGEIVVAPGEPERPQPEDQHRFDCYRPAPPDLSHTDAVVLAEIWVSPYDHQLNGADIRDRRLDANLDVYSLTADEMDVETLIDGAGVEHTGELADREDINTDEDVRQIINEDGTHGSSAPHNYFSGLQSDLDVVESDTHHTRYTNTEAREAVRGAVDAADLTGDSGTAGQHRESDGAAAAWMDPPQQTADPIASGTVTHTGGSETVVLLAGLTTDELAEFELAVGVDTEPTWDSDYAYTIEAARMWDDTNAQIDVELTIEWEIDPGSGNDLSMAWTAYEASPVIVDGRFTDADAIAAMDGAAIDPAVVDVSDRLTAPVVDDIQAIDNMEVGEVAIASGDGPSKFGQYIYDGSQWTGPLGTSVTGLSQLSIDTAKDWQGYPIENVGDPVLATDVARMQELWDHEDDAGAHHAKTTSSDIDHSAIQNVQPDQHHARYTDDEAAAAAVGRVFSVPLTGALIPSGEMLQAFHYVPEGQELRLVRGEVADENGDVPGGLYLQLVDRTNSTVVYQQSSHVRSGSLADPLTTVDGGRVYSVAIYNSTGGEVAASGSMSFEVN